MVRIIPENVIVLARIEVHVLLRAATASPNYGQRSPQGISSFKINTRARAGYVRNHKTTLFKFCDYTSVNLFVVDWVIREPRNKSSTLYRWLKSGLPERQHFFVERHCHKRIF